MKYFEYPKKNSHFFRFSSKAGSLFLRYSSVLPPLILRTEVGAKSVKERS